MNWAIWERIETLLDQHGVTPIVAIVPENHDPKLVLGPAKSDFWDRARNWQRKGWIIGLHGCHHKYDTTERGIVPWWTQSEFAGHPYEVQQERISRGCERFAREDLVPRVWVAPSHSFDRVTLQVLRRNGIQHVSDGFGFRPYRDSMGLVWIPAQPWRCRWLRLRVATEICHHNTLPDARGMERFLASHEDRLMGRAFRWEDVVENVDARRLTDVLFETAYAGVFRRRHWIRRVARSCSRS